MFKKLIALILALVCCLGILSGCNNSRNSNAGSGLATSVAIPFDEKVTIELYMPDNTLIDVEGCYVDTMIEKLINVDLKITEMRDDTQYLGMLAQKIVPDLTYFNSTPDHSLGKAGAYVNLYDYLDLMPNVKAYIEANPQRIKDAESENGALYFLPTASEAATNTNCWIWRKDILDKHNLSIPTTQEEWYNTLVTLKSLYPSSTPFVMRRMNNYQWDKWWANWGFTTNNGAGGASVTLQPDGTVTYPYLTDGFKEWITYIRKLIVEGLLYEGWDTMKDDAWYAAFVNKNAFVTLTKLDRLPYIIQQVQSVDPEATFVAAPCSFGFGSNPVVGSYNSGLLYHFAVGNNQNLSNTLAYINWLYSEEGQNYTNWGIEGETYTVDENGVRNFNAETLANYATTGLGLNALSSVQAYDAYAAAQDSIMREAMEAVLPYATLELPPALTWTADEQVVFDIYKVGVNSKAKEVMVKFMIGDMDIDKDWASFEKSLYDLGLQQLIDIHVAAYKRVGAIE